MAKARLLQAACTVALLAAAPAFAQQTLTPNTGAGTTPPAPAAQSNMAPADKMGSPSDSSASASTTTHRSHSTGMMHGRTDGSQDAAVDQLNEQSYQAAQNGQAFSASTSSGTMAPGGSGGMRGMSGGTSGSPPSSAASGSGGSTGSK
jgi:hypothetical protein